MNDKKKSSQLPSVGRMVHYYSGSSWGNGKERDTGPFAAIVCDVGPQQELTLRVYDRDGNPHIRKNVPFDDAMGPMTWSWPPMLFAVTIHTAEVASSTPPSSTGDDDCG